MSLCTTVHGRYCKKMQKLLFFRRIIQRNWGDSQGKRNFYKYCHYSVRKQVCGWQQGAFCLCTWALRSVRRDCRVKDTLRYWTRVCSFSGVFCCVNLNLKTKPLGVFSYLPVANMKWTDRQAPKGRSLCHTSGHRAYLILIGIWQRKKITEGDERGRYEGDV